ncbi:MAG: hypothetical protein R3B74_17995 [Nitrospirales bacterium]|nr:hypothetical protein [Nitrospirales bacterium]
MQHDLFIFFSTITEIISKWFSEAHPEQWITLGGILLVLGIIRVVAVQWSPTRAEPSL